jgi:hypothetical protein
LKIIQPIGPCFLTTIFSVAPFTLGLPPGGSPPHRLSKSSYLGPISVVLLSI